MLTWREVVSNVLAGVCPCWGKRGSLGNTPQPQGMLRPLVHLYEAEARRTWNTAWQWVGWCGHKELSNGCDTGGERPTFTLVGTSIPQVLWMWYMYLEIEKPVCGCPEAMPLGCCIWKCPEALIQERPQSCAFNQEPAVSSLQTQLSQWYICFWGSSLRRQMCLERYSDAYATEMYASLTGMTMTSHSTCQYQLKGSGCWLFWKQYRILTLGLAEEGHEYGHSTAWQGE